MWERISSGILRNRRTLIVLLVLITLFMGYFAMKVRLAYDNPKFVPSSDEDYIAYTEFKKLFGDDGRIMVIGINTPKIRELDFFSAWMDLTSELQSIEGINSVVSLGNVKDVVVGDDGYFTDKDIFPEKPKDQKTLDLAMERIHQLKFYQGLLYVDTTDFTLMALTLDKKVLDSKDRIGLVTSISKLTRSVCKNYDVQTHISGLPYIRTEMTIKVKSELIKFTLISLLITSLILWFFFRGIRTLIMSIGVVGIGVIWCLGIIGLFDYEISVFMALLPPLIVVIGIANCIYLINKYHEEFKSHQNKIKALQRVIAKVGIAVLFTNLTTAIGFGVLLMTGSTVLQEFGLVSFLSVMALFVISIILIPVISSFLGKPKPRHVKHLDYKYLNLFIDKISWAVSNRRKWVYVSTAILVALSVIGVTRIKNVGYMLDDISSKETMYKDLKFFEEHIGGIMPFEIVLTSAEEQGISSLNTLLNIDLLERRLKNFPEFSRSVSIAQIMKFLNQSYYGGDDRRFRTPSVMDIGRISASIPENDQQKLGSSFIDSTSTMTRVSLQMADIGSARIKALRAQVEQMADSIFNYERNSEEVFTDSIIGIELWDSAEQIYDTVYHSYTKFTYEPVDSVERTNISVTGTSIIYLKGNDYLISNLMISLVLAFVIISLMMAGIFTSARMIIISLVPNVLPLLFTAGIMGFSGVPFKPSTVLVFSVAFGIAVDFSIHFLTKYKIELRKTKSIPKAVYKVQKEISTSMIYTAVILFFGFIIFIGSAIGGTIALGLFTALTLLMALLSNLLLLPSLLLSYDIAKSNKAKPFIEIDNF